MRIFAHSHGVVLVEKALRRIGSFKGLEKRVANKIEIYAFGGATIILSSLAGRVENYVFDGDDIAKFGNIFSGRHRPLETIKSINTLMRAKNCYASCIQ